MRRHVIFSPLHHSASAASQRHCTLGSLIGRLGTCTLAAALLTLLVPVSPPGPAAAPGRTATAVAAACPAPASGAVYRASPTYARNVALTIDDGPSPNWTPQVLDILRRNHIGATFFVIADNVWDSPALVRRAVAEGSEIGNHTATHSTLTSLSAEAQGEQMDVATQAIRWAGAPAPCFFRAPGGNFSPTTLALARARGMTLTQWSNDPRDWADPGHLDAAFQASIVTGATSPAYTQPIVLLHDGSPGNYRQNTVNALQRIIDWYHSRGYVFTDPLGRSLDYHGDPVALRARINNRYVTAERAGTAPLIANRTVVGLWEQFDLVRRGGTTVALRAVVNNRYVTAESAGAAPLIANRTAIGPWEQFTLVSNADGSASLRAQINGKFVTAESAGAAPLIANRTVIGPWEKFDLLRR
jgi:peptidoglycan/xylan/chitin deacetylase (PgdA/CDA1 family)